MRGWRILWKIIKMDHLDAFFWAYVGEILVVSVILVAVEPEIHDMGNALWYCFEVITTIGFGDMVAVTMIGRAVTIILGLTSLFAIAIMTSLIVDYTQERMRVRQNESVLLFLDKMERLPELSKEELTELSEKCSHIAENLQRDGRLKRK